MNDPRALLGWDHGLNMTLKDAEEIEFDPRWVTAATCFFIKNIGEVSVYIEHLFAGRWVVRVQESFLNKKEEDGPWTFDHKHDIPNYQAARFSVMTFPFTFGSKEQALIAFVEYEKQSKHIHWTKRKI